LPWSEVFPRDEALSDWQALDEIETYEAETLFDLVNGQADAFFAYGFQEVAVRTYENDAGVRLRVEIWELASPADAYGLFTRSAAGSTIDLGRDGDTDPGRRLAFWQDRYYVQIRAREPVDQGEIVAFAEAIASALPAGGERPELVGRLPSEYRVPRSTIFFRREISIQDEIWLGGENVLGLSDETTGALARYEIAGAQAYLMLVVYPDAASAEEALTRLRAAGPDGLVRAQLSGPMFGAVFGDVAVQQADELLEQLLD
jgi:hypothetical protein